MTNQILTINYLAHVDINQYPLGTVWILDIDDTLLHPINDSHFTLTHKDLPNWMHQIILRGDPVCICTARYDPKIGEREFEKMSFSSLGLWPLNDVRVTRSPSVPLITYTNGQLKGLYVKQIINHYLTLGYETFVMVDDRITQIESCRRSHPNCLGIWVTAWSEEYKLLPPNYLTNYIG